MNWRGKAGAAQGLPEKPVAKPSGKSSPNTRGTRRPPEYHPALKISPGGPDSRLQGRGADHEETACRLTGRRRPEAGGIGPVGGIHHQLETPAQEPFCHPESGARAPSDEIIRRRRCLRLTAEGTSRETSPCLPRYLVPAAFRGWPAPSWRIIGARPLVQTLGNVRVHHHQSPIPFCHPKGLTDTPVWVRIVFQGGGVDGEPSIPLHPGADRVTGFDQIGGLGCLAGLRGPHTFFLAAGLFIPAGFFARLVPATLASAPAPCSWPGS